MRNRIFTFALICLGLVCHTQVQAQATCLNPRVALASDASITLIIDESGSMVEQKEILREGVIGLLSQLTCGNISVALVEFASDASIAVPPTVVTEESIYSVFDAYFESDYQPFGCTNWDGAFHTANQIESDLIVFFTDGNPNTIHGQEPCDASHAQALNSAIQKTCHAKEQTQILTIASGDVKVELVEALAGDRSYDLTMTDEILGYDYAFISDFTKLPAIFETLGQSIQPKSFSLATEASCGTSPTGSISVSMLESDLHAQVRCLDADGKVVSELTVQGAARFENLAAGSYQIEVEGGTPCSGKTVETIIVPQHHYMLFELGVNQATCTESGTITIQDEIGEGPFQYSVDANTFQATGTFTDLQPNTYAVVVRDANGCESAPKMVSIEAPADVEPIFENVPADVVLDCGEDLPDLQVVTAKSGCGNELVVVSHQVEFVSECGHTNIERRWSVNMSGETFTAKQLISFEDNEAPQLEVGGDLSLSHGRNAPHAIYNAYDRCSSVDVSFVEDVDTLSDGSISVARLWIATDGCGNQAEAWQFINIAAPPSRSQTNASASNLNMEMETAQITDELLEGTTFPNPTADFFSFSYNASQPLQFQLISSTGEIHERGALNAGENLIAEFDMTLYRSGMYYLQVVGESVAKTYQIVRH